MRLLGIDYGRKRIGIALGDNGIVKPLSVLINDQAAIKNIENLCDQERIEKIVVGLVDDLRKEVVGFVRELKEEVDLPIVFQDETLTTRESIDKMIQSGAGQRARRKRIDAVAAAEILESYFGRGGEDV